MSRQLILFIHVILLVNITFAAPVSSEDSTESVENSSSNESGPDEQKRSVDIDNKTSDVDSVETTTLTYDDDDDDDGGDAPAVNNTNQNLIVIKSVVYEIGILTDAGNDTSSNETHEEVDLSFFDPGYNSSAIDLSHIPIPIQTNVSGVEVTGVLPANFGTIIFGEDGTPSLNGSIFPLLPNRQIKVTHNVSTTDRRQEKSILEDLESLLGLGELKDSEDDDSGEKKA